MKHSALEVLVCPARKADLELDAAVVEGREILDGTLTCSSCHRRYAIRAGVPRFVTDDTFDWYTPKFDWYTPKYQFKFLYPEIFRWYQDAGFHEIEMFGDPVRMSGQKRSMAEESDGRQRWRDLVAS